jgi:HD-GYP domain-containing protein (c-di-GMP phosphodiesterase class II)
MTSERPYSAALSREDAIEELKRGAGEQFDPNLVESFLSVCEKRFAATTKKDTNR